MDGRNVYIMYHFRTCVSRGTIGYTILWATANHRESEIGLGGGMWLYGHQRTYTSEPSDRLS